MKRILLIIGIIGGLLLVLASAADAASNQTKQTKVTATVNNIFSLEFYTDKNVLYSTAVPFSSVDPTSQYNYADYRKEFDGKSDVGLIVRSNQNKTWYLKIGVNSGSTLLDKLAYYMGQPTNRNWASPSDGSLGHGDWFAIPIDTNPEMMYTAGTADKTNTPEGTLATISFKVDGSGLAPGSHTATVTYTLTETP